MAKIPSKLTKFKNIGLYLSFIGFFSLLIYLIVFFGEKNLEIGRNIVPANFNSNPWIDFAKSALSNLGSPLTILLIQMTVIMLFSLVFGQICKLINQPIVIGEIFSGIILGPSLFGTFFPDLSAKLFPQSSIPILDYFSQVGLILFLFVVGMELDLKILKNKAQKSIIISHASIVIPFSLGVALSYFIYTQLAPNGISFMAFSLFMGLAMSITAFPVLARIVQERNISKTSLGTIVITCAAVDDITAWSLLAGIVVVVKAGSVLSSLFIIILTSLYILIMFKIVRPFLRVLVELDIKQSPDYLNRSTVSLIFSILIISAIFTEIIGIHVLFGAFIAGIIIPDDTRFKKLFIAKIEDVALVLLLPIFFIISGLKTEISLLNNLYLWEVTIVIIVLAIAGKFIGSSLSAKLLNINWKDSLTIGTLMNTRGLIELVALNIAYDLGIITQEIFSMMVIMALVTTFMTGPILDLISRIFKTSAPNLVLDDEKMNVASGGEN